MYIRIIYTVASENEKDSVRVCAGEMKRAKRIRAKRERERERNGVGGGGGEEEGVREEGGGRRC